MDDLVPRRWNWACAITAAQQSRPQEEAIGVLLPFNIGKEIVGTITVSEEGFPDPSDTTGKWTSVRVKPLNKLARPVTLAEIKADGRLADCEIVRQSRLSVCEIKPQEWEILLKMAGG